ncbi:MAG TPA: transaldolase [Anaerolineales bacterium]|nr:transaldolase [Anaerolineales bacterium]HRQ92944.1 transaldolase [Anaerolineales bacterium]
MTTNPQKLYALGQSLWYDNIERRLLENGELKAMIDRGDIYGVTSNPSIFNNAIGKSQDYDGQLAELARAGHTTAEIYDALTVADIQAACDLFRALYDSTRGGDGYVSIEVHPDLAHDTEATALEAQRLWALVDRPNLMVKIPATKQGIPAIQSAIAHGININITLIFSCQRYGEVIEAYLAGLEERVANNLPIAHIASVASFFISRIDTKVDGWLDALIANGDDTAAKAEALKGKIAVANAKLAYQLFKDKFSSERFAALGQKGGRVQRPLWASTSTKNLAYPDLLYVDTLVGKDTVNTVPPQTLEGVKHHAAAQLTIEDGMDEARFQLTNLEMLGLSLDKATDEVEQEGVAAFSKAIADLFATIEQRAAEFRS